MREFFRTLVHHLEDGQPAVLVTVLSASGSTPRGAGAMMAVFPGGTAAGTIGGGNVEYEAQKLSARLLESSENAVRSFRFVQGDAASLGMVCGGDVTVHFQYLPAGDDAAIAAFRRLIELVDRAVQRLRQLRQLRCSGITFAAFPLSNSLRAHLHNGGERCLRHSSDNPTCF